MAATKSQAASNPIIDVQAAATAAAKYFKQLFTTVRNFSLEEVELTDDEKFWLITLSYEVPQGPDLRGIEIRFAPPKTKFKVFKVNAQTGAVHSMKMRQAE